MWRPFSQMPAAPEASVETAERCTFRLLLARSTLTRGRAERLDPAILFGLDRAHETRLGMSTPRHIHSGQKFTVVIAGNLTLLRGEDVRVFGAGESWVKRLGWSTQYVTTARTWRRWWPPSCFPRRDRSPP